MASSASGHVYINPVNVKKTWTSGHISLLFFLYSLPVISDNMSRRNRLLHFDSSIPCKLAIVWGLALFTALSPPWHTSVHKAQHYCISKPEWSDLFAGITKTSPTLLNRVEELVCRGSKHSPAAIVSWNHHFGEHQESWSILLKFDVATLSQCLNALDLLVIGLKIACFQHADLLLVIFWSVSHLCLFSNI